MGLNEPLSECRPVTMRAAALCAAVILTALSPAFAQEENDQDRAARWKQLQESLFPHRNVLDSGGIITVEAPPRALRC